MQSYSQDLRERVLGALDRGDPPSAIARRYEVSRFYVYQVRDRERETGVRTSFPIGGHRRSRLAEWEPALRGWIASQPGLTLAELQERLASAGVAIKVGALWHQLNQWNLTFKKNPARRSEKPPNGLPKTYGRRSANCSIPSPQANAQTTSPHPCM